MQATLSFVMRYSYTCNKVVLERTFSVATSHVTSFAEYVTAILSVVSKVLDTIIVMSIIAYRSLFFKDVDASCADDIENET